MRIVEIVTNFGSQSYAVADDFEIAPDDLPESFGWFLFEKNDRTRVAVRAEHILSMNVYDEALSLAAA